MAILVVFFVVARLVRKGGRTEKRVARTSVKKVLRVLHLQVPSDGSTISSGGTRKNTSAFF